MIRRASLLLMVAGLLESCVFCSHGLALEVLEPGYVVETYAGYSDAGIERSPWDMVFADNGNLYLTQLKDNSIWCITPYGAATELVSGVVGPTGIVWGVGTSYGDYLYVAITSKGVIRVDLDGTTWNFASRSCAGTLGLDRTGNYGGYMYTTTGCVDHTYRVHPDGSVTMFTSWPTWINGGGPHNIAFDNRGNYGGLFFVAAAYSASQPHVSGLFTLDPGGSATRFTEDIVQAYGVDFDPAEGFGGDMFVIGRSSFGEPDLLWRVSPDGTATEFATLSGLAPRGLTFGPDGAMYVGEYISQSREVIVSRISPYNPIAVVVDIKPGSCPNPLNVKSKGVLPVAILGSEDFDVNAVDVASIRLAGVAPIRGSYEDVGAPVIDANDCNCTEDGPDGYLDLTLKFKTQEIVEPIGEVNDGD
ncbi:MAG: hypothetical protein ACYSTG_00750, partial [Planctomycetota bacterium]